MTGFDRGLVPPPGRELARGRGVVDAQAPEHPVIYVNPGFEALTGYSAAELVGAIYVSCRRTIASRTAGTACARRSSRAKSCRVLLRNYRKDGSVFWNEMTVLPLLDPDGRVTHFVGHHRDAGERLRIDPKLRGIRLSGAHQPTAMAIRDDRLTGLLHAALSGRIVEARLGGGAARKRSIAVFADRHRRPGSLQHDLRPRRRRFDHSPRGACGVGVPAPLERCHGAHRRRQSDRLCPGLSTEQALRIGQLMAERVRDLRIHHPRSAVLRYISMSVGVCAAVRSLRQSRGTCCRNRSSSCSSPRSRGAIRPLKY